MKLDISLKRVNDLFSRFEDQVRNEASIGKTDLNKTAETIVKSLLNAIYGWNLENVNYAEDNNNHPGIDLGDKTAKVCVQVTATASPEKVRNTLRKFIKYEQYLEYDRLIVFFLKKKQSYQSKVIKAFQDIVQDKVHFDTKRDILDCRDLYKEISNFEIERVNQIREILEANFGGDPQFGENSLSQRSRKFFIHQNHLPNLPPHLLPRPKALDELKELLFSHSTNLVDASQAVYKIGVCGMGGLGKSVLTAYLARDPEVQAEFLDGIFWIPLGQEPNLTLRQSDFAKMLGDAYPVFRDVQQGKVHLSHLLANKKCLLVLDDAWEIPQISAFDVLEGQSKIIFTTRDSGIINALNAVKYSVNLLTDNEALDLLAISSGNIKEGLPPESYEVAKECANLPLALAMVGAIAKARPNRWNNLLQRLRNADLDKLKHQFPDYPYPDLFKAIQVSLEVLDPDTQLRYLEFAVFPESVEIPETTLRIFWEPEGLDEYAAQDIIDLLVERSLVRRSDTGFIILHDLQYDYVRKQFSDLSALHNRFLYAFSIYCSNGWHTYSEKDDYFFRNLAYHLKFSDRKEELYNLLLVSDSWRKAKFVACSSDASYLSDLDFATKDFHDPLTPKGILTLVQLYAARQVINHKAQSYSNEELEALALLGRVDEAISHARLRPVPFRKFYGLLAVINALDKDSIMLSPLLEEAHEIAQKLEGLKSRHLCELAVAFYKAGKESKAKIITAEAKKIAYQAHYVVVREEALAEVVSALAKMSFLEEANTIVQDIQDGWPKCEAMGDLAASLLLSGFEEEANTVFEEATNLAQEIADLDDFHEPIISVFGKWSKALVSLGCIEEAFTWIEDIEDSSKTGILCDLAEVLAQFGLNSKAKEIYSSVRDIANHTEIYDIKLSILRDLTVSLARSNYEPEAVALLKEINNILTSNESLSLAVTLGKLAASLIENGYRSEANLLVNKSMQIIRPVTQDYKKIWSLGKIAVSLTRAKYEKLANQVLAEMREISERGGYKRDLVRVFAQCGYIVDAKNIIEATEDENSRNRLLSELIEQLVELNDLINAKCLANIISDHFYKATAFIKIMDKLISVDSPKEAYKLLPVTRDCISFIEGSLNKSIALVELAKAVANLDLHEDKMDNLLLEVRNTISQIQDEADKEHLFMEYVDGSIKLDLGIDVSPFSWRDEMRQNKKIEQEALNLALDQKFSEAFSTLSKRSASTHSSNFEDFFEVLGLWIPGFDQVQPRLSLAILRECIRVSSWISPAWKDTYFLVGDSELFV